MRIEEHGPLFDGGFGRIVDEMIQEMVWEVGAQASANVHHNADGSFKNPTPYYETQITVERHDSDVLVHDRGVVYGPWLEGVSSRNALTRFKGYHIWRRAAQEVERQVPALIGPILARYLARLRGGG